MTKFNFKNEAENLMEEFIDVIPANTNTNIKQFIELDHKSAKNCTLIMVRKLIECTLPCCEFGGEINGQTKEYWQEIEKELIKL